MTDALGYIIGAVLACIICVTLHLVDKHVWSKKKKIESADSDGNTKENNEYFLECLADPWILMSIQDFIETVSSGGFIDYDGFGYGVLIDKETLKLSETKETLNLKDFCFPKKSNVDLNWADKVKEVIKKYSNDKYQLIAIEWFNK